MNLSLATRRGAGLGFACGALATLWAVEPAGASAPVYGYEVVDVYPHDAGAFTQGLIMAGGFLYEGTGIWGESSLRKVDVESGAVLLQYDLPSAYFGEGITALRDTIYQLTWTNHVGFAYVERDSFELVETYPYPWDGWGLTHDGTHLIASDGSPTIRFLDPTTKEELSQIAVQDGGMPVDRLNELEYIQGRIYANVWGSDFIAVIHPATGEVESWLDLSGLRDSTSIGSSAQVLNGIAFEPQGVRLFVTGKRWARIFEIDVEPLHPVGAPEVPSPGDFVLRAYPNPARRWMRFVFAAPAGGVTATVFDHLGRAVPARGRSDGERAWELDAARLAPGVYFVKLVSRGMTDTAKVLVVR